MCLKLFFFVFLLVGVGFFLLVQVSSDDFCYFDWLLVGGGVCDILLFFVLGNDICVNLCLLLVDVGYWWLVEVLLLEEEKFEGYGLVLFGLFCLLFGDGSQLFVLLVVSEVEILLFVLVFLLFVELVWQMGVEVLLEKIVGVEFFEGEGSCCCSNDQDSVLVFFCQVCDVGLGEVEIKVLVNSCLELFGVCGWE